MTDVTVYRAAKKILLIANTAEARLQFQLFWIDYEIDKQGRMVVYRNIDVLDDLTKEFKEKGLSVEVK